MNEIITIASSTWKNVLRMKVVYFLIFCALVLVGSAYNYDVLSMGLQKELMIDVSLVLNSIAAMLVVISLTFEIPKELREGRLSASIFQNGHLAVQAERSMISVHHTTLQVMSRSMPSGRTRHQNR